MLHLQDGCNVISMCYHTSKIGCTYISDTNGLRPLISVLEVLKRPAQSSGFADAAYSKAETGNHLESVCMTGIVIGDLVGGCLAIVANLCEVQALIHRACGRLI
jgi:hypothetical protein